MENKNLQKKSNQTQLPDDLVDSKNLLNDSVVLEKSIILFDFFMKKDGDSSIIKTWASNFNSHPLPSFCDILSTILQLAGKRIEISIEHIESDAFDIVLEEFQEATDHIKTRKSFKNPTNSSTTQKNKKTQHNKNSDIDSDDYTGDHNDDENTSDTTDEENESESEEVETSSSSQIPPLTRFLKDKVLSKTLSKFWHELSEAMISCNALYSSSFINFRQWLIAFNKSEIRIIRQSSTFCALSLFNTLAVSLNRLKNELFRILNIYNNNDQNFQNSMVTRSKNLYEQDIKFYTSISQSLLQQFIYTRINDVDENIRMMAVQSLTDAAIDCPSEFADFKILKCFEKILNDRSSRNRRDVLRCIQRILSESPLNQNSNTNLNTNDNHNDQSYYDKMKPLAEKFVPIILGLFNDKENSVVSSAIDCLFSFTENNLFVQNKQIEELCINYASSLLSDESQAIRAAAAKFISKLLFGQNKNEEENNSSLKCLIEFLQKHFCSNKNKNDDDNINNEDDLPIVISSLFPNLPCLHDWDEMIDILSIETDNDKARILAKILYYSAEKLNSSNNSNDYDNQIRKLSLSLVKFLPTLIKGYQKDDDIVLSLVDAAKLINLDVISENSYEHYFQKLLAEICNIFLHSSNRVVFTTSISSLYELSARNHQLSLIARHELDRLAVECGNDCDMQVQLQQTLSSSHPSLKQEIENIVADRESIAKFVAAARLVDVSDNGKLRSIVVNRINTLSKAIEQNHDNLNFDSDFSNVILEVISDCIECLQFIFRWDMKHVHNKKISKNDYIPTFKENLDIFYRFLTTTEINQIIQEDKKEEEKINSEEEDKTIKSEEEEEDNELKIKSNAADRVKENAFKALGDVIALSPFLKENFNDVLIESDIIEKFYFTYHTSFSRSKKVELFIYVMHPIRTRAIDMSYASHILVYFGFNPLQQSVKAMWKDISQGRNVLIYGNHLLRAFFLASVSLNKVELRLSARFMLGKVKAIDFIEQFLHFELDRENSDDKEISNERYETIVASALPFFFGLTSANAKEILDKSDKIPSKYNEILNLISNNEKPTQKSLSKIIQASKSNQNRNLPSSKPTNKLKVMNERNQKSKKKKNKIDSESLSTTTDSSTESSESSSENDDE
ncbi:Cohesin subunit SA-3 [Tritrichomonas musculus]|uniref:Cohesin subunit SA-3 n=1 Tax=Tritrichomonas musculus TaxID=1915356 RepID=A0ABR2KJ53_9EUKA